MAGDVERHRVGEPVAPQLPGLDPVDGDRVEQILIDRQRGARHGRRHEKVGGLEPALDHAEEIAALEHGALIVGARPVRRLGHLAHQRGRHAVAVAPDHLVEARLPGRVVDHLPRRAEIRQLLGEFDQLGPQLAQPRQRLLEGGANVLGHQRVAERGAVEDAPSLEIAFGAGRRQIVGRLDADRPRVRRMRPGHRLQHQGGVHHCARHRRHIGVVAERVRHLAVRDHAVALLQPDHAVDRGGNAGRAAAVGGDADRPDAGRDRDRRTAARAAGRVRRTPGIARAAKQRTVGQRLVTELRRRRLAEQDAARGLHARRADRVFLRHVVLIEQGPEGGAHARRVHEILGGERDAVQQAERLAAHHGVFGRPGRGAGLIRHQRDEAVQHRLQLLGARQHGSGQFDGRDFPGGDLLAQVGGGQAGEVGHGLVSCSSPPIGGEVR